MAGVMDELNELVRQDATIKTMIKSMAECQLKKLRCFASCRLKKFGSLRLTFPLNRGAELNWLE